MTLLEILIVIAIVGMIVGIAIPSFNSFTHYQLRKTATTLSGTIRYLYSQAALKGLCMRLVFDIRNDIYHVEASTDGHCLIDSEQKSARKAKRAEDKKKREAKRKAREKASSSSSTSNTTIGGWGGEKPISLELKKATFQRFNKGLLKRRIFSRSIKIQGIFVIHQKETYTKKKGPQFAYLHCFPLGRCERAVIYLQDTSKEMMSLEVHPLTGRVTIHRGKLKLQEHHRDRKKGADNDF